jgi:EAL domain-containing protein (putative c-di-GMP-specific phosphodiesterase class I)
VPSEARAERDSREVSARRVLVVDDDPSIRELYSRTLAANGYSVALAESAIEAQSLVSAEAFDAIVSDITMPEMTGLELLRLVRQYDLDVPVILVTAQPDVRTAIEAVEHGAFRYLLKPVALAVLVEGVGHAARLHRMARLKREAFEIGDRQGRWLGDRAALEGRFQRALDQLWIAYQRIVVVKNFEVFGYEALARSEEPSFEMPAELFAAAEQLGRLHDLGRAIRARVALDAARAPQGKRLFVNVHAEDLNDPELASSTAPLTEIASRVVLEITDRSRLDSVKSILTKVAELRQFGFQIAVDDLGAGYAGLSSFVLLEPDLLKIDMSLIRAIEGSKTRQSIVQAMLGLSKTYLSKSVICEGIETQAECDTLIGLGAELLQGNLFGEPGREFEGHLVTPKTG